jgi:hypothetical protein
MGRINRLLLGVALCKFGAAHIGATLAKAAGTTLPSARTQVLVLIASCKGSRHLIHS